MILKAEEAAHGEALQAEMGMDQEEEVQDRRILKQLSEIFKIK